jgi:hypothetical protein
MDGVMLEQQNPFAEILQLAERTISPEANQDIPPNENARVAKAVALCKKVSEPFRLRAVRLTEDIFFHIGFAYGISVLINEPGVCKARGAVRMRLQVRYLLFELLRQPEIVRVDDSDILSNRHFIEKRIQTECVFGLKQCGNSFIRESPDHFIRAVDGMVVRMMNSKSSNV